MKQLFITKKYEFLNKVYTKKIPQDGICQSGEILEGTGINQWGDWSSWTYCPPEAAVCGLQTRVQSPQGDLAWEDDAGLTDIKLLCCQI